MKITRNTELPAILSSQALKPSRDSDLLPKSSSLKPPRRKSRTPSFSGAGVRLKRDGAAAAGKRSRPETPLLRWKFDAGEKDEKLPPEVGRRSGRKVRRESEVVVSARKLAAGLWRLQPPEYVSGKGERHCQGKADRLGFQYGVGHGGKAYGHEANKQIQSSHSFSGPRNGFLCKPEPSFQFYNSVMEGATKWDPLGSKTLDEVNQIYGHSKPLDEQIGALSVISKLKVELEQSQARIYELENERRSSKKKLENFLQKLSEERGTWRSKEHEKVRAIIDDIKADLKRERKNRQRVELVNSKLVSELSDVKLAAKRFMQDYEKERQARELLEEVCEELAKEVGEDKDEAEALKRESEKFREEVEEERRMLQIAEVWREERVQMKLVDAKLTLEEKYSQMNKLVADLETFLNSRSVTPDVDEMRKVEFLRKAIASVNIQDIKDFTYDPPNPDDIFSIFEDMSFGENNNEKEIEQYVHTASPQVSMFKDSLQRYSNEHTNQNGDIEDGSGWETESHLDHLEYQGSNYSPKVSHQSVNNVHRDSNALGSGTEWEKNEGEETQTPITEISEVYSVTKTQLKKVSSISRLWRSYPNNIENYKIISVVGMNGRVSSGAIISPDRGSDKGGLDPSNLVGRWSPPDPGNPLITRGMKGCIEWPLGMQKNSLKSKLLEARKESQKIQLRQVLKQRI